MVGVFDYVEENSEIVYSVDGTNVIIKSLLSDGCSDIDIHEFGEKSEFVRFIKMENKRLVCALHKTLLVFKFDESRWVLYKKRGSKKKVSCITLHKDFCYFGEYGGDFYRWDMEKDVLEGLSGHVSCLFSINVSLNGEYLVTTDRDCKIRISSCKKFFEILSFCVGHKSSVTDFIFLDDSFGNSDIGISCSASGELISWKFLEGLILDKLVISMTENGDLKIDMKSDSVDDENATCIKKIVFDSNGVVFCLTEMKVGENVHGSVIAIPFDTTERAFDRSRAKIIHKSENLNVGEIEIDSKNSILFAMVYEVTQSMYKIMKYSIKEYEKAELLSEIPIKSSHTSTLSNEDSSIFNSFYNIRLALNNPFSFVNKKPKINDL